MRDKSRTYKLIITYKSNDHLFYTTAKNTYYARTKKELVAKIRKNSERFWILNYKILINKDFKTMVCAICQKRLERKWFSTYNTICTLCYEGGERDKWN